MTRRTARYGILLGLLLVALVGAAPAAAGVRFFGASCSCRGVGTDAAGNIWLSDVNSHRITRLSPSGQVLGTISSSGSLTLSSPFDSVALPNNNVAVADQSAAVHVLSPSGAFVTDLPVSGRGIATDPTGNVYVTNSGASVTRWQASDGSTTTWTAASPQATLDAIAYNPANGRLYATDSTNSVVYELTTGLIFVSQWGDSGAGQLNAPSGISADSSGNLYIAQPNLLGTSAETTIKKFSSSGTFLGSFDPGGQPDRVARFGDYLYVTNFSGVYQIDLKHPIATFAGDPQAPQSSQNVSFSAARSSLPFGSITRYEWDLDGDGAFETDGGSNPVATRRFVDAGTYTVGLRVTGSTGETSTLSRQIAVSRSAASLAVSPNPALTDTPVSFDASASQLPNSDVTGVRWDFDGDGGFETDGGTSLTAMHAFADLGQHVVGVQVTRTAGVVDTAQATVEIRRKPAAGPVGVSINEGARFTNHPEVALRVVWPALTLNAVFSNDGGFGTAKVFPVALTQNWTLDSSGPERLPKTVYVRFDDSTQTFQDDIILDETPPTIQTAEIAGAGSSTAAASAAARKLVVKVRASDKTSGVHRLQFATKKKRPAKAIRYAARVKLRGKAPRFVRVEDWAGNFSRWRQLRRAAR